MRFVDFIDYLSDDAKRQRLQSFIDSESVNQLVAKVQHYEVRPRGTRRQSFGGCSTSGCLLLSLWTALYMWSHCLTYGCR